MNKLRVNHYCRKTSYKHKLGNAVAEPCCRCAVSECCARGERSWKEFFADRLIERRCLGTGPHAKENMVLTLSNRAIVRSVQEMPQRTMNQRRTRSRGSSGSSGNAPKKRRTFPRQLFRETDHHYTCTSWTCLIWWRSTGIQRYCPLPGHGTRMKHKRAEYNNDMVVELK